MILHAPHSKLRIASSITRNVLSHKAVLYTAAGTVLMSLALNTQNSETHQIASVETLPVLHRASLPAINAPLKQPPNLPDFLIPEEMKTPRPHDIAIQTGVYNDEAAISYTTVTARADKPTVTDQTDFVSHLILKELTTVPSVWKPETVQVASLTVPDIIWTPLEQERFGSISPVSHTQPNEFLQNPDDFDTMPDIGGLETEPAIITITATSNDSLDKVLTKANLFKNEQQARLISLRSSDISEILSEGDKIDVAMLSPDNDQLLAIRLRQTNQPPVELRWDDGETDFWSSISIAPVIAEEEKKIAVQTPLPKPEVLSVTGRKDDTILIKNVIHSSLFSAAAEAGLTAGETQELSDIFRYSVDFDRDLRKGDYFEALFEKKDDGAYGDILYAKLKNRGKEITLYRHIDPATGKTGYFDAAGKTNKRTLMRTPLNRVSISSHYGMRKHPILGYNKMHRGTDFRAPTGTPIFAAGNGVVVSLGRKGAYGKYIRIRHNNTYQTAYAHMSRYARGLRKGNRVRQGEIIGYVGNTGRSTGPHLHFEILKNGRQINPMKITDFGPVKGISGSALSSFKVRVSRIEIALSQIRSNERFASAE